MIVIPQLHVSNKMTHERNNCVRINLFPSISDLLIIHPTKMESCLVCFRPRMLMIQRSFDVNTRTHTYQMLHRRPRHRRSIPYENNNRKLQTTTTTSLNSLWIDSDMRHTFSMGSFGRFFKSIERLVCPQSKWQWKSVFFMMCGAQQLCQ